MMADDRQRTLDAFVEQKRKDAQAPPPERSERSAPRGEAPPPDAKRKIMLDQWVATQREAAHRESVARDTEQALDAPRVTVTPPASDTWAGLLNRLGRAASLELSDLATAKTVQWQLRDEVPDLTFEEAVRAVRKGQAEDRSIVGEIAGSLAPAVGVVRGATKLAQVGGKLAFDPATKAAVTQGAARWAMRNPRTARFVKAASAGAAAGAVEEGVRVSVSNAIGTVAGEKFDGEDVKDAVVAGALIGGIAAPAVGAATTGGKTFFKQVKNLFNLGDQQTQAAASRILRAAAREGEKPADVIARLQQDAQTFLKDRGYMPTMSELMPPEKVRDVTDVARLYSGLGDRTTRMSADQVDRALASFDRALGGKIEDTSLLRRAAKDQFNDVMQLYGTRRVNVPDDVLETLSRNSEWVSQQARNNPSAREIQKVIDARANIGAVRDKMARLSLSRDAAVTREEVADVRLAIANLIDRQAVEGGEQSADEILAVFREGEEESIAALRRLASHLQKQAGVPGAQAGRVRAETAASDMERTLAAMRKVLDDYETSGLRVPLSDANAMRSAASDHAFNESDLAKRDTARAINAALRRVGVDEVPAYGKAVDNWSRTMSRVEAQDIGVRAAADRESAENIAEFRRSGLRPDGRSAADANMAATRQGLSEGARKEMRRQIGGRQMEGVRTVETLAESRRLPQAVEAAAPREAGRIVRSAEDTAGSIERLGAAANNVSPTQLQEQISTWKELAESGVINRLGGAATAGLGAQLMSRFTIPRGTARKIVDMMLDPDQMEQAFRYLEDKGIQPWDIYGAVIAAAEGRGRESRERNLEE